MSKEKTKFDRAKDWFKNQWLFVAVGVFFIGFISVAKFFSAAQDLNESVDEIFKTKAETSPKNSDLRSNKEHIIIKGKIVDSSDRPIKNSKVEVLNIIGISDYSDDSGFFILDEIVTNESNLEIIIEKSSFQTFNKKVLLQEKTVIDLGKIILTKEKPLVERKGSSLSKADQTIEVSGSTFSGNVIIGNDNVQNVTINKSNEKDSIK